ncbi:hypothetical protein D9M71_790870 [compost metagenome]
MIKQYPVNTEEAGINNQNYRLLDDFSVIAGAINLRQRSNWLRYDLDAFNFNAALAGNLVYTNHPRSQLLYAVRIERL